MKTLKFGFIPIEGGRYYPEFMEQVLLAEALGFDSVWLEEHHGVRDHYWPSPLVALAGMAARTERILFGTDIIVMPFYHPVRVAEDVAMLDIMSHGRFILGAAIGYKPDEFALYGIPLEKRGARFEEAIRLIQLLWMQDKVDFDGAYFQLHGLGIEPHAESTPRPPIWLGGWGERSLARAAQLGDAWVPGPTAHLGKLLDAQRKYFGYLRECGVEPESRPRPLTREVVVAESDAKACEMAARHLLISYRDEYGGGEWKHPLIGREDTAPVDRFEELARDRFLVGSPDTVIRQLQRFQETFGVDHLICRLYFPGMTHDFITRELKLLAQEVMPAFRLAAVSIR